MQVLDLLDKASNIAGSDYKLAKRIGVTPQRMSDWRNGRTSVGVEYRALMADVAGLNVDEVIREALLEKHANTPLGEKLLSILGNVVHGVAAIMLISASAVFSPTPAQARTPAQIQPQAESTMCIMLLCGQAVPRLGPGVVAPLPSAPQA